MTLNEIKQRLEALKEEQDNLTAELERLKSEKSEVKPWRADKGSKYHIVDVDGKPFAAVDDYVDEDNNSYIFGNYYRTRELAEQDAMELALRGRVRQLRDALCEGYQFVTNKNNWTICFDTTRNTYIIGEQSLSRFVGAIYFDSREHAQQACDILNAERKDE